MVERLDTTTTSEYGKVVLSYISEAVKRYVRLDLDCLEYFGFFENGGLEKPCPDVVNLIECVNSVVEYEA